MGYFSLSEFIVIEELEAWRLTCLPLTTGAVSADGRISEKLLKSSKGDIVDIDTIVGKQGKKCRLVAMQADPKVSAARRPERRKKARDLSELDPFDPDPRHVGRDNRTRKSPVESGILALT